MAGRSGQGVEWEGVPYWRGRPLNFFPQRPKEQWVIDHRATHWMLLRLACYEANPEDPEGALDELLEGFAERAVGNLSHRKVITDEEIQDEIDSLVRAHINSNVSDAFRESGYVRRLDEAGEIVWRLPDSPK